MLLCRHITIPTVGVIRETENSGEERSEASGRHQTQKNVLIRTFHLVRLDFIVCAVSLKVLLMGVTETNTVSVESNIC